MSRELFVPEPAGATWPSIHVYQRQSQSGSGSNELDASRALLAFGKGAYVRIDRNRSSAGLYAPRPRGQDYLVHPFLTTVGAVFARWRGQEPFHGGAFAFHGRAWGVLGDNQSGKSSTLAALALGGASVVSDDLLIAAGEMALAGPRCVDLRPSAAHMLDVGDRAELVRARRRHRLRLEPVEGEIPLGGWIFLAWGRSFQVRPLSPVERLLRLAENRAFALAPVHPAFLIELSRMPAWELRRPRRASSVGASAEQLLATVADASGHPG